MKNNVLITVIIVIVVGGAAFFGGMQYQKSQASSAGGYGQGGRFGGARGVRTAGGATVGSVISQDANSITLQLQDGSSKIINISGSTTFSKTDAASKSAIQNGTRIGAFGTSNSDGSITAQTIQINPMARAGGQGGPQPTQAQ